MSTIAFLLDLAAAIGIGAMVGLEREHRREDTKVYAGVRTFPLIASAGFLISFLSQELGSTAILAVGVGVAAAIALAFFLGRHQAGDTGFTTPMAILVTFLAGTLIGLEMLIEAVTVAVATTFLLLTKDRLHRLAETLEEPEIMGALQFVALAFIALPLAQAFQGPVLGGLIGDGRPVDPEWMLYIVVVASALAFASFVAMRELGSRHGFPMVGAFGGLVNSVATTAGAASIAKGTKGVEAGAAAAVLAAIATAFGRNIVLVAIADPSLQLLGPFTLVIAVPILIAATAAVVIARRVRDHDTPKDLGLKSPFAIKPALLFALVFAAVNAIVFYGQDLLGSAGVYASSLGALISSGAVVASAASLVFTGTVDVTTGLILAGLALAISTVEKIGVLAVTNRSIIGHVVLPIIGIVTALGVGILLVV